MKNILFILLSYLQFCYGFKINGHLCDTFCHQVVVNYGQSATIENEINEISRDEERIITKYTVEIKNKTFEIYPNNEMKNLSSYIKNTNNKFTFLINYVNFDLAGEWKSNITTVSTIKVYKNYDYGYEYKNVYNYYNNTCEIVVEQKVEILPTNIIEASENNYVKLYFNDFFEEMTDCQLIRKTNDGKKKEYFKLDGSQNIKGVKKYSKCGLKMKVDKSMNGNWELIQKSGEYKIKKAEFKIKIRDNSHINTTMQNLTWTEGSEENISIPYSSSDENDFVYCEWVQPNGHTFVINQPNCTYIIKKVTKKSHAGIWTCRFKVNNKQYLEEAHVLVQVQDSIKSIQTSVDVSESSTLLKCRAEYQNFDYCMFRMPNGTIINLLEGSSNQKYEYYGQGFSIHYRGPNEEYLPDESQSSDTLIYSECGLKLYNSSYDGAWKCIMGWKNDSKIISAYIPVNVDKKSLNISANNISIKAGDSFLLQCTVNAQLSYCAIENDNIKFSYASTHSAGSENLSDLDNGICEVLINNAEWMHNGEWKCQFGIKHLGIGIEKSIQVDVRNSYLISQWRHIKDEINNGTNHFEISCELAPEIDDTIDYCRWECLPVSYFLSDTNTITEEISAFNSTTCLLQIKYKFGMSAPGKCKCYAGLTVDDENEIVAVVT